MKYLILTLILFSNLVHAGNWLNQSKIKSGSIEAYSLKSDCERISGEDCYDLGNNPSSVFSEVPKLVDDTSKPIYSKNEIQSCASIADCDLIFSTKTCLDPLESPIKNYDLLQVYCSRFLNYEQKTIQVIELDQAKLSAWQSQEAVRIATQAKENAIQSAIKRLECGKRVIGLLIVRNAGKGLTEAQVKQSNISYSSIKGLIETGSLLTAKNEMQVIEPDGVLITAEDKADLINEITKCL